MSDVFDLGEPADSPDDGESAETGSNSTTDNNANNASTQEAASNDRDKSESDPTRTPAYDTNYQSTQRTIGVRDETWDEVTDLLEDAQAYSKLDGYRDVTQLEAYEALFQHLLATSDAKDIASVIQTARHEAHDEP